MAQSTKHSEKGEQARKKILRAGLKVLEKKGYHQMRVVDVTRQANVATGLFYHYFKDLHALTIEALNAFISASLKVEKIEKNIARDDWYERIYAHNQLVVRAYVKHPGVMRCLFQMADQDSDFAARLHAHFVEQLSWLVKLMPNIFPQARFKHNQDFMLVYALAGCSERILRDYYIKSSIKPSGSKKKQHQSILTQQSLEEEEMCELLSVVFYRGLFLQNPPLDKLRYLQNIDAVVKTSR